MVNGELYLYNKVNVLSYDAYSSAACADIHLLLPPVEMPYISFMV